MAIAIRWRLLVVGQRPWPQPPDHQSSDHRSTRKARSHDIPRTHTHEPGIELAEATRDCAPGLSRVFYAGDGSSAVEAAIKMAYQAQAQRGQNRPCFAHFAEGCHGDTLGAVSVGGIDLFHATYRPILLQTKMVSSPGILEPGQRRLNRAAEVRRNSASCLSARAAKSALSCWNPRAKAAGGLLTTMSASFAASARSVTNTESS